MVGSVSQSLFGRLVSTVVVGAVAPLVGWMVAYVMIGSELRRTLRGRGTLDLGFGDVSNLTGVALMAYPIACLALLGAFYLTEARHPVIGFLLCVAVLPLWFRAVNSLDVHEALPYLALIGVPPAVIRLFMPARETSVSITGRAPGQPAPDPHRV